MGAFLRGLITKAEFKNFSSTRNKYRDEMEKRCAYVVLVMFFAYNIFSFEMWFSLKPLCHTKRHDKYIFTYPPTHLKRQIDVLRDKMGMDVATN